MQGEKVIKGIGKDLVKSKKTLIVQNNKFNNSNKNFFGE